MDIAFSRAAFSPVIAEANDRSNGIYARDDGALIAQGELGLPIFVGTMQDSARAVIDKIRAGETTPPEPDDIYIVHDPYLGGTHLMDVRFIKPFFHEGEHWCWLANTGHWPDIGGAVRGGFSASATEIEQEGLRLPPVKLFKRGRMDPEIYAIIISNIRVADQGIGDIKAQAAAPEVGARRLTALLDRYGKPTVEAAIQELRAAASKQMRARIKELPDGSYQSTAWVDSDGIVDEPLAIRLTVTKQDDTMTFDLTESSPPCQGPMNSVIATKRSSIYPAVKRIWPEVPINAGLFEPLTIIEPRGTFLYAEYPRPVSGCAAEVSQRIAEAVFAALVQAAPDRVTAAPAGTSGNFALGGFDPARQRSYVMYHITGAAMAATPRPTAYPTAARPSASPNPHPWRSWSSNTRSSSRNTPLAKTPAAPASTGAAWACVTRSHSGAGSPMPSFVMDHCRYGPQGVLGGEDGAPNRIEIRYRDGRCETPLHLSNAQNIRITEGDTIHIETPGGGGYGDPTERDPALIERDKRRGYVRN